MCTPGINAFFDQLYGDVHVDLGALAVDYIGLASGRVFGTNPPYTLSDFLAMYPKFFGTPSLITATLDGSTSGISALSSTQNLKPGQLVTGAGIPNGTVFVSVNPAAKTAVLSNATTAAGTAVQLTVYAAPPMPMVAIQLYINLASASLMQARWLDTWTLAMALYVAHFCTLYMRSEAGPNQTASQIATSGLEKGVTVSKSAGGVSVGVQVPQGLEAWGGWTETTYGTQLVNFAQAIGSGPIWVG
jgi:hypothetical protein